MAPGCRVPQDSATWAPCCGGHSSLAHLQPSGHLPGQARPAGRLRPPSIRDSAVPRGHCQPGLAEASGFLGRRCGRPGPRALPICTEPWVSLAGLGQTRGTHPWQDSKRHGPLLCCSKQRQLWSFHHPVHRMTWRWPGWGRMSNRSQSRILGTHGWGWGTIRRVKWAKTSSQEGQARPSGTLWDGVEQHGGQCARAWHRSGTHAAQLQP